MAKAGTVVIELDANTAKLIEGFKRSERATKNLQRTVNKAKTDVKKIAAGVIGVYALAKSFTAAFNAANAFLSVSSQFEQYENRMAAFTSSVEEQKSELLRARKFAMEYRQEIGKTTETLLLMKNYGLKDTNEQLKVYTNTAIGAGKSIDQFAEAMADALTGENERLKEFGIKASQQGEKIAYAWSDSSGAARNIVIDNNKEIIDSTLTAIFNEKYVGQLERYRNSWAGIGQGISNMWTTLKLNIAEAGLLAYFKNLGTGISQYMSAGFKDGSISAKTFADDTISFINTIVKSVGFLVKAISGAANLMRTVYAGYLKLDGAIGQNMNKTRAENARQRLAEYEEIKKSQDYGWSFSSARTPEYVSASNVSAKIKEQKKELEEYNAELKRYTDIRKAGDDLLEKTAQSQQNINNLIDGAVNLATKSAANTASTQSEISKINDDLTKQQEEARKNLLKMGAGFGGLKTESKEAAAAAKKLAEEAEKARDALAKARSTDEEWQLKELGDELANYGKYLKQSELAEIYKSEVKKMSKVSMDFTDQFRGMLEGIFSGDLADSISGFFDGVGTELMAKPIQKMSESLSDKMTGLFSGLGDFGGLLGGLAMSGIGTLIGGLLSSEVSQAEIDAAKGRVEFDDNSLKNLGSVFETAQYPMLEVTSKMHKHIRNMDANFFSVARALNAQASAGGVDLTGVNFVDTMESGFLGFSSKSISLIGSGLKFEAKRLSDMMDSASLDVQGYTTSLVKKSSFWGLKKSSKIRETYKNLPKSVVDDMADTFANGFEAILTAGTTLGLDAVSLEKMLLDSKINLGKIDFTGLSPSEVSDRLSQAFSTSLSGVVNGISEFSVLVDRYAKNSEYGLETLIRISTEYDQASHQFDLIGAVFNEGIMNVTRSWTETTQVMTSPSGFFGTVFSSMFGSIKDRFTDGFGGLTSVLGVFGGRFTGAMETITKTFTETTQEIYTTQMQMLDVVNAAGGLQSFQDSMGAFMDGFYTEEEKLGFMTKSMQKSFESLGLKMPKTNEEFKDLYLTLLSLGTEGAMELAGQVITLADSFNAMTTASDSLNETMASLVSDIANNISDAWLSNLSYLTLQQKAAYASAAFEIARDSGGALNSVESARAMVEAALRSSSTKEEYKTVFDTYIEELEKQAPEATTADVVEQLRALRGDVQSLDENMTRFAV